MRCLPVLFFVGLLSCNGPQPDPEKHSEPPMPTEISPTYYTTFDISEIDSALLSGFSCCNADSVGPYKVKILNKKALSLGALWEFRLEDSIRVLFNYHIDFRSANDSMFYDLTRIEMGKHQTWTEGNPDAFCWELASYSINDHCYYESDIYLTDDSTFIALHPWLN